MTTRYMEKDKWSQKVIAFQLTIGVLEKDLDQVGLLGDRVLVITVPNYQFPIPFLPSGHMYVYLSVHLSLCLSAKTEQDKTRTG